MAVSIQHSGETEVKIETIYTDAAAAAASRPTVTIDHCSGYHNITLSSLAVLVPPTISNLVLVKDVLDLVLQWLVRNFLIKPML